MLKSFFEEILADRDDAGELVDLSDDSSDFEFIDTFDIDQEYLDSFLQNTASSLLPVVRKIFPFIFSKAAAHSSVVSKNVQLL